MGLEHGTPYRVQVNTDIAEAIDEECMLLAVRTLVGDQMQAGIRHAHLAMVRVEHNGEFSPVLTRKAWKTAREVLRAGPGE